MKVIAQIIAGSRLYGLDTPESDTDTRGVFLNTLPSDILGLGRFEIFKRESEDTVLFELRHFLAGLRKTNTNMLELLHADEEDFQILEPEFGRIQENRDRLVCSRSLFKSLLGYIGNERRLALGERTGRLGGKRKANIEKYGFSPKNFSHLLRLARCGAVFFETGKYPVNIRRQDPEFAALLLRIKSEPGEFALRDLETMVGKAVARLEKSFHARTADLNFDTDLANSLCLDFYLPFLAT